MNRARALIVFQSNRDHDLRQLSAQLVGRVFSIRRAAGIISPSILFAHDEADEFIPSEARSESYEVSLGAATTLARRGRKFGMAMAISTQRVAYLNTSIMAQPHTYLISKLPRKYDRETIVIAFEIDALITKSIILLTKGCFEYLWADSEVCQR